MSVGLIIYFSMMGLLDAFLLFSLIMVWRLTPKEIDGKEGQSLIILILFVAVVGLTGYIAFQGLELSGASLQ